MPDFAGSPQSVIVSRALFVLLALPLLGLLAETGRAAGALFRDRVDARERIVRTTVVTTALATVAFGAQLLGQSAGDKYLLQHLVPWLRAGQLDANLDLAFDPLACLGMVVILGAIAMVAFRPAGLGPAVSAKSGGSGRSAIGLLAVLFGAVFALLSVDFFGILAGLGIALTGLVTTISGRRQAQLGFGALALLGGATALFFWGSGGDFHSDGFASDFRPRLVSVQVGRAEDLRAPAVRGEGLLTVMAYPGAPVFLDDSRTPLQQDGHEVTTPFARLPIPAGLHSFRVHPGLGQDDEMLTQVPMGEGRELMIVPVGSSLAPRQIADQLVLQEASGDRPLRAQALGRSFSGHGSVLQVASLLAVAFALVWSFGATLGRATQQDAAARAVAGLLGAYVLARVLPIAAPSFGGGGTGWMVLLVGVAALVGVSPLMRGRIEAGAEMDAPREPLGEPAWLASLAETMRPLSVWLAPAASETGAVGETGEPAVAAVHVASRVRVVDVALAAALVVGLLLALVGGR